MPSDTTEPLQPSNTEFETARRLNISTTLHTFSNFQQVTGADEMLKVMRDIAGGNDRKFAFFYGTTGNGKTFLIESLLIEWARQGIFTRYNTNSQIMRMLKRCMNSNSAPSYEEMFDRICSWDRLIIDDVGMGTVEGTWELSTLEDIINERYHRRYFPSPIITIMATNKDITQIPDRITSRFYDAEVGVVVCNRAPDFRRRRVK